MRHLPPTRLHAANWSMRDSCCWSGWRARAWTNACWKNASTTWRAAPAPATRCTNADALQQLQKRFVAEENAIDPQKRDTPAFTLVAHARSYYQARLDEAAERERQLTRNREATGRRVERRKDWSDEQKRAALQRADARLIEGRRAINAAVPAVELVPVARCPEAYAELFLFWFENHGKSLPDMELRRLLHPMLQFAKKAARGLKLQSERVAYEAVPKLGKG